MTDCVLLFSGGLDSTLCALQIAAEGAAVHGLSVVHENRPAQEVRAAHAIARVLPFATFHEIDLRGLAFGPPAHARSRRASLEGVIPHRNLVFWALAANRARAVGAGSVAAGHTLDDARSYSDAGPAFFRALERTLRDSGIRELGSLAVRLPLHERPAAHWRALLRRHRGILAATWSCWRDGPAPCGECFACRQRERVAGEVLRSSPASAGRGVRDGAQRQRVRAR